MTDEPDFVKRARAAAGGRATSAVPAFKKPDFDNGGRTVGVVAASVGGAMQTPDAAAARQVAEEAAKLRKAETAAAIQALASTASAPAVDLDAAFRNVQQLEALDPEQQAEITAAIASAQTALNPGEPAPTPPPAAPASSADHNHNHNHIPTAGAAVPPERCPRCLFDLSQTFAKITDEDKTSFTLACVAPRPFEKTYNVGGMRLAVTFRDLRANETDLLQRQLQQDVLERKITSDLDYMSRRQLYRMMLGTAAVAIGGKEVLNQRGCDFRATISDGTGLTLEVLSQAFIESLQTEAIAKAISNLYREFSVLVDNLQAWATSPNFSDGIDFAR